MSKEFASFRTVLKNMMDRRNDRIKELEKELSQAYENAARVADDAAWNRSDTRWERRLCQGVAERIRELKPNHQNE